MSPLVMTKLRKERLKNMKRNRACKTHIKKNQNYRYEKENIAMKNTIRKSETIDAVMKNQQAAQEAMPTIVKEMFELVGLNTEHLSQAFNKDVIEGFVKEFNVEPQKVCEEVFSNDDCRTTFDVVMTDNDGFVSCYNKLPLEQQFIMYMQMVMYLSCSNYTSREYMLNTLFEFTAKFKNTEEDHISERAWMLFLFLTDPRLVTLAALFRRRMLYVC